MADDCFEAAAGAVAGKLTRQEAEAAFQRVRDFRARLRSEGGVDASQQLRRFGASEAERTRIAAAMQRRHAALNVLVRDRLDQAVTGFIDAGMTPKKALLAVLEGTQKGVEGGRNSVAAMNLAYEARYLGGLMGEIQANRPELIMAMRDPRLDADIMREMAELKEGGKPGITGNKDAQYLAKVFASYAEMSRTDLNRLGASIGKLDGWSGAQTHDDIKLIGAGKEAWMDAILPKLDIARTFPDVASPKEIEDALSGVYDTLVTGFPNKPTPKEVGQRVNPANLAKSLGKSRVLHFKDADAALAYRNEFGFGNTVSGMVSHLRNAARVAANMEVLGPNPEVMFNSLVDGLKRKIKNSDLAPETKNKQIASLNADGGALRQALDISTGLVSRPVNTTAAKIGSDLRAVQSMAKLGGALLSSVSDTVTTGIASMFRGSGFWKGFLTQLDGLRRGRPKGELAEISYLLGEGFDGLLGHIVSPAAAVDGPVGKLSALQEKFFRLNGLSWWTDVQRATAGRAIAAEMGMRSKTAYASLPANYRHVLGLHGIKEAQWEAIRKAGVREANGKDYVTPDLARNLPDEAVAALGKNAGDARRNLELQLARFFADETSYGVIETDPRSRRTSTLGLRPGTAAGEAIRFIMQFKGFPVAFAQRQVGRALFGHGADASLATKGAHIGALLAGMTMAGYAAMTMKDMARGYWPPRDPSDPKTWTAALVQGGALGIYGDYLFGQVNRMGGDVLETTAGPVIGSGAQLIELWLKAREAGLSSDEEVKLSDWLNYATQNTPFINLFYTRPAIDYLFLNSMREVASPGYTKRTNTRRRKEYGQQSIYPEPLRPFN